MTRFLVEAAHDPTRLACARVVDVFLRTGSHYFTHADWGCRDGEHKAWAFVEAETREDARRIVPPPYRSDAKVVELNAFTKDEIDDILRQHEP
jgi:hypothetical protein